MTRIRHVRVVIIIINILKSKVLAKEEEGFLK
jgi:hypothetical protein